MSNTTILKTKVLPNLSVKMQTLAAIAAISGAVAVPQVFYVLGALSRLGTALGETFLPMYLPIILVGLLAGSYAGAIAGLLGPFVSFALSGMPRIPYRYDVSVRNIVNRAGTGNCPMEMAVWNIVDPEGVLRAIRTKLKQLMEKAGG